MFGCGSLVLLLLLLVLVVEGVDGTTTPTLRYNRDLHRKLQSSTSLDDNNDNNEDDGRRAFRYDGYRWYSRFSYAVGQTAAFGNPLRNLHNDNTDVNTNNTDFPEGPQPAQQRTYNLLLPPPPHPSLCELPSLIEDNNETAFPMVLPSHPAPLALFVSLANCSAEQSARVAVALQNRLSPRLELLVVYSGEPDPPRNDSYFRTCHGPRLPPPLQPDEVDDNNNRNKTTTTSFQEEQQELESVGILYVNEWDAADLVNDLLVMARGYYSRTNDFDWELGDPQFLGGRRNSADWFFPLHVAPFNESFDHEYHKYDWYCLDGELVTREYNYVKLVLYLLFLAFLSVCGGGAYFALVWFGCGGGPWRWRRTPDGRIRGCYPTRVPRCCRARCGCDCCRCCGKGPLDDGSPVIVHKSGSQH